MRHYIAFTTSIRGIDELDENVLEVVVSDDLRAVPPQQSEHVVHNGAGLTKYSQHPALARMHQLLEEDSDGVTDWTAALGRGTLPAAHRGSVPARSQRSHAGTSTQRRGSLPANAYHYSQQGVVEPAPRPPVDDVDGRGGTAPDDLQQTRRFDQLPWEQREAYYLNQFPDTRDSIPPPPVDGDTSMEPRLTILPDGTSVIPEPPIVSGFR